MAENNYITCPKCNQKYHVKAGQCPRCKITPADFAKQQAEAKKKAAQKAKAKAAKDLSRSFYCTSCGSVFKKPKLVTKGYLLVEIFAWLMFLIPGIIYSIWRHTTRYKACPICKAAQIIPADSPIAAKMLAS